MKPLSERDENVTSTTLDAALLIIVGMKPLSERDENILHLTKKRDCNCSVGMKPLSERDENPPVVAGLTFYISCRNEATL